jgi:DNA-binding NarL/FixJ family response regulator
MHDNETIFDELLRAGARGYVLKSDAKLHILDAIDSLAAHRPFFSSQVSEALLTSFRRQQHNESRALTPREREIVKLIAEGHSNKEVAVKLGISLKTVETHRASIMRKLNLSSSATLVRYAIRNKLVET